MRCPALVWICALIALATLTGFAQAPRGDRRLAPGSHPASVPAESGGCTSCHQDLLRRKVIHGPVALGMCGVCHEVVQRDGKTVISLVGSPSTPIDRRAMCTACHADVAERLDLPFVHAPVEAGGCTLCHDPHGSEFRFMLEAEGKATCLMCHEAVGDELADRFTHEPAARSCAVCHDPHGTPYQAQTRERLNELCLRCHFDQPAADASARVFARVLLPLEADLASKGRRIGLDATLKRGHPMMNHLVEGTDDPSDPGHPLTCASCHAPHGARTRRLLEHNALGSSALCLKCHKF